MDRWNETCLGFRGMKLLDTTLREGLQRWGVYFPLEVRVEIARRLISLGVEEIELGVVGDELLPTLIQKVRSFSSQTRLSVWLRLKTKDLALVRDLGLQNLNLSVPVSPLQLKKRLRLDEGELLALVRETVLSAREISPRITLGLEDVSRARIPFFFQICKEAVNARVWRLRLSDTLGLFNPREVSGLCRRVRKTFPGVEVVFHGHNDFGLASANAISALLSGAHWVDVSILGLGERAGLAKLEEVVAYLHFRLGQRNYRVEELPSLCRYVAWQAGEVLSEFKPVTGRKIFFCESGLHVEGLKKSYELYEPFPPERLGLERRLSLGAKSGRRALSLLLQEWNLRYPPERLNEIWLEVRKKALLLGRPLEKAEIEGILDKFTLLSVK